MDEGGGEVRTETAQPNQDVVEPGVLREGERARWGESATCLCGRNIMFIPTHRREVWKSR